MSVHTASLVVWAALAAAVLASEVLGLTTSEWPTLGDLVHSLMRPTVGRWVVLVGWVWLGWHVFVR